MKKLSDVILYISILSLLVLVSCGQEDEYSSDQAEYALSAEWGMEDGQLYSPQNIAIDSM